MGRFDKYMLQQLLMLFGFFSLVLALVFWVNKAVSLLDWLMGDGQSASTFVQLTLLSLPTILVNLLPIAAFAATVYVTNRLSSESELVVVQAAGYSPYRLARPVMIFGAFVAVMVAILAHVLVPMSHQELDLRRAEIAEDVTARLLTEGAFVHPVKGITFYVRNISPADELEDVYLSNSRDSNQRQSFMASRALIVKDDSGPMLLMFDGMSQTYETDTKRLSVTRFDSFAYSLEGLLGETDIRPRTLRSTDSLALLRATPALRKELNRTKLQMFAEVTQRMNKAVQGFVICLVGFGALLIGGFSRFGLWRQIVLAILLLVVVKTLDNGFGGAIDDDPRLWPLRYLASLLAILMALVLMWKAAHPRLRRKKDDKTAPRENEVRS
ncbi:LPS export ABC transporter permease LptF [uncultured Celeribacter sp.]|uniref:LPS export ABC transporter permease LptF n=1 Tax=uncultured Celeribacter sp. TaxID=1303376 RepID=UPI00374A31D6